MLAPIQVGMLAGISHVMGLDTSEAFISTLVSSAAGVVGATYAGRLIFTNILKLIPGVGSAAGAVVGAATAVAITEAMGNAYVSALRYLIENGISLTPEIIAETFKKLLKKQKV